jgi:hypothetical protein
MHLLHAYDSSANPRHSPNCRPSSTNLLSQLDTFPSATIAQIPTCHLHSSPISLQPHQSHPPRTLAVRQQSPSSNETSPARPISPHVPRNKLNPTSPANRRFAICLIITPLRVRNSLPFFSFLRGFSLDSRFYSCFAGISRPLVLGMDPWDTNRYPTSSSLIG